MFNPIEKNEPIFSYLHKLAETEFWGSMTLKFEGGRVVHIRKEESLKPDELSEKPRIKECHEGKQINSRTA